MKTVNIILLLIMVLTSITAWTDGKLSAAFDVSTRVVKSVKVTSQLIPIAVQVDPTDNEITQVSQSFEVKANSNRTIYNIWMSASEGEYSSLNNVYLARHGEEVVPFYAHISGMTNTRSVESDSFRINNISGSNLRGTIYTVSLKEAVDLQKKFPPSKKGIYTIHLVAHVELAQ